MRGVSQKEDAFEIPTREALRLEAWLRGYEPAACGPPGHALNLPAEVEAAAIGKLCSPEAMADEWVLVLAGLRGVEDAQLDRLALKAQALCGEERDPGLRAYVENRIDEIVFERRASR